MSQNTKYDPGYIVTVLYIIGVLILIAAFFAFIKGSSVLGGYGILTTILVAAASVPFFFFGQVLDHLRRHTLLLNDIKNILENKQ